MSFDTPAGTRGGRQPRAGLLLRLINKNAASRFRRRFGWLSRSCRFFGSRSDRESFRKPNDMTF